MARYSELVTHLTDAEIEVHVVSSGGFRERHYRLHHPRRRVGAILYAHSRTLLVLDGLEPLQNPPGPQEGRLREPSLQALLRELAAFNTGLCVITTRTPVADLADHERSLALRRELERLSSAAGAKLLCALGVKGHEAELRTASYQVDGHCLALTLLGSFLTDAYDGDIRYHAEVSGCLGRDVRQGFMRER